MTDTSWTSQRKCNALTPKEADKLFFGGPGSKPTQAEKYCAGCPVLAQCLDEAIRLDLEGFVAGTTQKQRKLMARFKKIVQDQMLPVDPPEEKKTLSGRRPPQKRKTLVDTYDYLLTVEAPF